MAVSFALSGVMCLVSPTSVLAQATPPDRSDESPLKGPSVAEPPKAKGKSQTGFGPDAVAKKTAKKPAGPLSMAEFVKAIDVLRGGATAEGTRVTSDEDAKIKMLVSEFEASTKAYMDAHQKEIDALRAKLSSNDRVMLDQQLQRGGPIKLTKVGFGGKSAVLKQKAKSAGGSSADSAPTQSKDDAARTRTRLVELYSARPKPDDVQGKVLGLLTPEQLKIVNEHLANRDEMSSGRRVRGAKAKKV